MTQCARRPLSSFSCNLFRLAALLAVVFVLFSSLGCGGGSGGKGGKKSGEDNKPPVADAGNDATASLNATVALDGTGSRDPENDGLTFTWRFISIPPTSAAALTDPASPTPSFVVDRFGTYRIELIVNDGEFDSDADTVEISAQNAVPTAAAGTDQTVALGALVSLDGSASSDPDGDSLTFSWTLSTLPVGSTAALSNGSIASPTFTVDRPGAYTANLVVNDGALDSAADSVTVTTSNSTPLANAGPDLVAFTGDTVELNGSGSSDPDGNPLTFAWSFVSRPTGSSAVLASPGSSMSSFVPDLTGSFVARLIVNDGSINSAPDTTTVAVTTRPPVDSDGDGLTDADEALLGTNPNDPDSDDDGLSDGEEVNTHGTNPNDADSDDDGFDDKTEIDAGSNPLDPTSIPDDTLPPDPTDVAPDLGEIDVPPAMEQFDFLYSGVDPIQTGVDEAQINRKRIAVVRGKVMARTGAALPGVEVSVSDHPELGQTLSRADGMFDLAVNGGGNLVIDYRKNGYLPAQRTVYVAWNDFAVTADVALIPLDPVVTEVTLGGGSTMQIAQGGVVADGDGTRQATILFPATTTATYTMPGGASVPIGTLNIRATEFTVGEMGLASMPGILPPTSAYTYAVDWSVDEAMAAGATRVDFSQPLPVYVDNFLGFPTGGAVPTGYYDYESSAWVPSDNGLVIEILAENAGLAEVDIAGNGQAANASALASIAMSDAERAQLAALYEPGQSFWRTLIPHFSPWDHNWPGGYPPGAGSPPNPTSPAGGGGGGPNGPNDPGGPDEPDGPNSPGDCPEEGSIIICQSQTVGERVPVTGSRFSLHYNSGRMLGRTDNYMRELLLAGPTVPAPLERIDLDVIVAGRTFKESFPAEPNQTYLFHWDGRDAFGRVVQGAASARVESGYVFESIDYQAPAVRERAFAQLGLPAMGATLPDGRSVVVAKTIANFTIGQYRLTGADLGGWTLTPHHRYDPTSGILHRGDGTRQEITDPTIAGSIIERFAGNGVLGSTGDGGPATEASMYSPSSIAVAPDGAVLIASDAQQFGGYRVRRVGSDGIIETYAGTGVQGDTGDGGPAVNARLGRPLSLALATDGSLYIATLSTTGGFRVRRIDAGGIITTVIGGGAAQVFESDPPIDGVLGTDVAMPFFRHMMIGPDGLLYVNSNGRDFVRLELDGVVSPFDPVSTGVAAQFTGTGAWLLEEDGSYLYPATISSVAGIYRLAPSGQVSRVSTAPSNTPSNRIKNLAKRPDGRIFFTATSNIDPVNQHVVYSVVDGLAVPVAGVEKPIINTESGNGGLASRAEFPRIVDLEFGPDGALYVGDSSSRSVRRIAAGTFIEAGTSSLESDFFVIASEDGGELYVFNAGGRHLETLNALTGSRLYEFQYDDESRLLKIVDGDLNETQITRDIDGRPTSVVAPGGQVTSLTLGIDGYLDSIRNPANEATTLVYGDGGLLSEFVYPSGDSSQYAYDEFGRLTRADDPAGGYQEFDRSIDETGRIVTLTRTTALGKTTTYVTEYLANGGTRQTITFPDGKQTVATELTDGTTSVTNTDGTTMTLTSIPDSRFGMMAPISAELVVTTAGGLTKTVRQVRTVELADPDDVLSLVSIEQVLDVNGNEFTYEYDAATRTTTVTTPEGHQRTATTDPLGRGTSILGFAQTEPETAEYDGFGRLIRIAQGIEEEIFTYDDLDRIATRVDAATSVATFAYDLADRVTGVSYSTGDFIGYGYDANGKQSSLTMPDGNVHEIGYSSLLLPDSYTPPGSAPYTRVYNLDRALETKTLPSGRVIANSFDARSRWNGLSYPEADVAFVYEALGDRIASNTRVPTGAGSAQTLTYEHDGPIVTRAGFSGAANGVFDYVYDDDLYLSQIDFESGLDSSSIAITRDNDGAMTGYGPFVFARNALGGALSQISDGTMVQTYAYDSVGRVQSRSQTVNGVATLQMTTTRNNLTQIVERSETVAGVSRTLSYGYDAYGQLTGVSENATAVESYSYDPNGNRLTAGTDAATYDTQDRITEHGGVAYVVDADGNMTNRGTDAFSYSSVGELMAATVGGATISYAYDGIRRRVARTDSRGTHEYLYGYASNPFLVTASRAPDDVLTQYYYDLEGYLIAFMRDGAWFYVATDQVGTPLVVTNALGAVVKLLVYDSFGRRLSDSDPTFDLQIGFAGGLEDTATGLVRFGFRDFDQASGRFTARDPVLYGGGQINLYAYVGNRPVHFRDPLGLWCVGASGYEIVGGNFEVCYDSDEGNLSVCAGAGIGKGTPEISIGSGDPKFNEDIAEFGLDGECFGAKLGVKCTKSTRCGGLNCTPTAGIDAFEIDGTGEAKVKKEFEPKGKVKKPGCDLNGKAEFKTCLRENL